MERHQNSKAVLVAGASQPSAMAINALFGQLVRFFRSGAWGVFRAPGVLEQPKLMDTKDRRKRNTTQKSGFNESDNRRFSKKLPSSVPRSSCTRA
jgi:hypothetical protein